VNPPINGTGVAFDTSVSATMTDGADVIDAASVKLSLDGTELPATATKTAGVTTISHQPTTFFASGSQHTASLTFRAGTTTRTETWQFTVAPYGVLGQSHQATSFDRNMPGFVWNVFQNESFTHTTLRQTEDALAGRLMNGQTPVTENFADPNAVGVAMGAGTRVGSLVRFQIEGVINMSQIAGEANGNFPDDGQMPGIPGANGLDDGIDGELITYADLPAGVITMGVNSDDGFRTQAGYISVPADGILLGQFDGGRGAADTLFKFLVETAGVYPLRTIWQEGGGGANIEWFTVKADGTKVLLNDRANGGIPTYRVGVAPAKPAGQPGFTSVAKSGNNLVIAWDIGTLESADSINGPWTPVANATSPATVAATGAQKFYRLR
jgi:hypothetical protein